MSKKMIYILSLLCAFFIYGCEKPNGEDSGVDGPDGGGADVPSAPSVELDDIDLIDFSYAGYDHGQSEPQFRSAIYNIKEYKKGGMTDREAFIAVLTEILGKPKIDGNNAISFPAKADANAVIYFPEGEYILHDASDDTSEAATPAGASRSQSILIPAGNIVLKGDGAGKSIITMKAPMQPKDPSVLYSSPEMIQFKHNTGMTKVTSVDGDAKKGEFSVHVENASQLSVGDWVCLYVKNNDPELVRKEVAPYEVNPSWIIATSGVEVIDYHQIKYFMGNKVYFHEPLVHDVEAVHGWEIKKFPHYENVGVEDLTFRGYAKADFAHHGSWEDDGGYKPLNFNRLVNSWVRRVEFESVSEACNIVNSANVSAYCITMKGNRGHSAIRSQASSRVLIAGTIDETSDGQGNFHAVGVSKQSIGTVLLRNIWGKDSCFESHANQPRATLIDHCKGALLVGHQGGNANEAPHHLADLVLWNFEATDNDDASFIWWDPGKTYWRLLPPLIVGFRSAKPLSFTEDNVTDISHGFKVSPESLYESQLAARGHAPGWINEVKLYINN